MDEHGDGLGPDGTGGRPGLTVQPAVGRVDEPLRVRGTGLPPGSRVKVGAALRDESGVDWRSEVVVTVRPDGTMDLAEQAPDSGDYSGADWAGLLWSMHPAQGRSERFLAKRTPTPMTVTFTVEVDGEVVVSASAERHFGAGVRNRAADGDLVGRLYSAQAAPGPGVLLLAGSDGGVLDHAASLLADEGYAVLSLALSGVEGRPKTLHHVDVEYCLRAIAWLAAQPECSGGRVAVVGLSRGAELALQLGALTADVAAVVAGSPSHVRHPGVVENYSDSSQPAWLQNGEPLPFIQGTFLTADPERAAEARIEVERIRGPVLLVAGADDRVWPSALFAREVARSRRGAAERFADELLLYERAGHLVCFPYAVPTLPPMTRLSPFGPVTLDFGGSAAANAASARDSWTRICSFLKSVAYRA